MQDEDTSYGWADNGKGQLEKRTVELGEYDEGMDMYEIKSGLKMTDYIAWPVSGFHAGLKTTTNMDEGMVEEYPEDDMISEDAGEGMMDESDMQPSADGSEDGASGADTGSADTPAAE